MRKNLWNRRTSACIGVDRRFQILQCPASAIYPGAIFHATFDQLAGPMTSRKVFDVS